MLHLTRGKIDALFRSLARKLCLLLSEHNQSWDPWLFPAYHLIPCCVYILPTLTAVVLTAPAQEESDFAQLVKGGIVNST